MRLGARVGPFYATGRGRRRGEFSVVWAFVIVLVVVAVIAAI